MAKLFFCFSLCLQVIYDIIARFNDNNSFLTMAQKLIYHRLQKQQAGIQKDPIPNAIVTRDGHLNFHFCLYDLQGAYSGGLYHGLFELHENYPFNAPKLFFYTPSGRFEINLPICTSFTNYHQETWTSAWNVRSLILATISFMYSEEPSYGCMTASEDTRKQYAKKSKEYNFKTTPKFDQLFGEKLLKIKKITPEEYAQLTGKVKKGEEKVEREVDLVVNKEDASEEGQREEKMLAQVQRNENQIQQPLLPQDKKGDNNRRNELTKAIIKGVVCVTVVAGVYLLYRYIS